jgi:hypothetical protein
MENAEIEKKEKGFFGHLLTWVAWVFCVLAVYVLSLGPVMKLAEGGNKKMVGFVEGFYAPIGAATWNNEMANEFIKWYLGKIWGIPINRPRAH